MTSNEAASAKEAGPAPEEHTEESVTPSNEELTSHLQVVATQYRELNEALKRRRTLRTANTDPQRPDDNVLKKLDSSVKRNTALVKKLRQANEETRESLLEEVRRTNQSKYVSEAVAALSEANVKPKDINAAVQIASLLHQRYADFGTDMAAALVQNLSSAARPGADEERPTMAKRRAWLRLLGELQALGIAGDAKSLLKILQALAAADFERDREGGQAALSILAAFAKPGREEFLGLPPKLPAVPELPPEADRSAALTEAAAEVAKLQRVNQEEHAQRFSAPKPLQEAMHQAVVQAFEAACTALQRDHQALLEIEQQNLRALNSRGELPEEMAAHYEGQRKTLDSLQKAAASLAETLDRKLPVLQSAGTTRLRDTGLVGVITGREVSGVSGPFDDEETRAFYESLPDVRALVPSILLSKGQEGRAEAASATGSPADPSTPTLPATANGAALSESLQAEAAREPQQAAAEAATEEKLEPKAEKAEMSGQEVRAEVEAVLRQLLTCTSCEAADEVALAFCYVNSKGARRRLVRTLLEESRGGLQQLPFYARITAVLAQVFPDVSAQLLHSLEDELSKLLAKKDSTQRTLEARLRNCRFIAELTKFRICPYGTFFTILKSLLDDFTGHNIDTAASFVETAGRFLFLLPETNQRMSNMLEVMMKLKNSRNVDSRQSLAVDSAYLACKPPERATLRRSRHPPHELYMRHLVHDCLTQDALKQVTRKLRRFSWPEHEHYMVRCLLSAVKGRFSQIPMVASLAASLSKYHPTLGVALADALLEEIRSALESPELGLYQRRVGHMRLLGELYNYRIMDSRTVFDTLYLMLSCGHESPEEAERLDPANNYFRVRLVCVLLSTCGQYFSKGSSKQRLDRFLVYFQRYLLFKPPLPLDVEFDVQDLFQQLRPKLERFESFEEACKAVEELEADEAARSAVGAPTPEESESEGEVNSGSEDGGKRAEEEQPENDASEAEQPEADEDEDEQVRLIQPLETAPQEVDEEFERELAALTLQNHITPISAPAAVAVPAAKVAQPGDDGQPEVTVAFKVMLRRGGREEKSRAIEVPASLALAIKSREDLAADAAERAEMKRLVLEASQREEDGDSALNRPRNQALPQGGPPKPPAGSGHGHGYYSRGGGTQAGQVQQRGRGDGGASQAKGSGGRGLQRGRGRRYSASTLPSVEEAS